MYAVFLIISSGVKVKSTFFLLNSFMLLQLLCYLGSLQTHSWFGSLSTTRVELKAAASIFRPTEAYKAPF